MSQFHLAQINIGRALGPIDSSIMQGFVSQLDEVNALADQSPGFVWRLQGEGGDATDILAFDDPMILINMSVWENIEDLRNYTYGMMHSAVARDRRNWFEPFGGPHLALWWVPAGHIPTPTEGRQKIEFLTEHGPTAEAFTFLEAYSATGEFLGAKVKEEQSC